MSWGTTFCPPIGPSVRQSLLIWIKAKGPHCVLLFLIAKILTPQSARGRGFAEIIPPPCGVGIRVQMLCAPGGQWEGWRMSQLMKHPFQNIHPYWVAHVGHWTESPMDRSLKQFQWKLYPYGTNQGELCSGYSVSPYHIKFLNYTHMGPTHLCL